MRIDLTGYIDPIDWKTVAGHTWFAWRPVLVRDWEWRWLENVKRTWQPATNMERDNGHWTYEALYD